MKKLLSVIDIPERASFYAPDAGRYLLNDYDLDGFELVYCGHDMSTFPANKIYGLHLPFFADWLDLWLENYTYLDKIFGSRKTWQDFYTCKNKSDVVKFYEKPLQLALDLDVDYVVFHVSQVAVEETFTRNARYSDREVIDCAIELINLILQPFMGRENEPEAPFYFLMENLWWAGFNLKNPEDSRRLIEGIEYRKKGFVLDSGHLLSNNPLLKSRAEASSYILKILHQHQELLPYFKALHLHKSLSGPYVLARRSLPYREDLTYEQRFAKSYYHVENIDRHEVWDLPDLDKILQLLPLEYLIYEFKYESKAELKSKLAQQNEFLRHLSI